MLVVEVIVWAGVLVMVMLLLVGFGRARSTQIAVMGMARDAARAASQGPTQAAAQASARRVATDGAARMGVGCQGGPSLGVTGAYTPGGLITARVACTVALGDLTVAGFPGSVTFTESQAAPVETFLQGPGTP